MLSFYLNSILTDYFAKKNKVAKFYFVVDRLDLLKQASQEFTARGLEVTRVNSKEEFEIVEKILFTVTTKAIVMRFKYDSKEEARENFLKQIEYLKYGIMRGEKHV